MWRLWLTGKTATLVLFGGALAGAAIYVYITSKDEEANRKKSHTSVPGLRNLGNTCYMNALLQGLASCPSFASWLDNLKKDKSLSTPFLTALQELVHNLNDSSQSVCSAAEVIEALHHAGWHLRIGLEQDLYELFNVFVTTWDEELGRIRKAQRSPLSQINTFFNNESSPIGIVSRSPGTAAAISSVRLEGLSPPCAGLTATQLRCCQSVCGFKVRQDRICVMSVAIPKSVRRVTLELLLKKFFTTELIREATCDECKKKGKTNGGLFKRQGFSKLPQMLLIRVERVGILPSGVAFKHSDFVDFPETLDVRDLCFYRSKEADYEKRGCETPRIVGGGDFSSASLLHRPKGVLPHNALIDGGSFVAEARRAQRTSYRLVAVSEHGGIPESGHFITYRRKADLWFLTNDSQVTRVPFSQVASCEAYMLFYERLQPRRLGLMSESTEVPSSSL